MPILGGFDISLFSRQQNLWRESDAKVKIGYSPKSVRGASREVDMNVTIVPIPPASRGIFAGAPGWQETEVPAGKRIARHYHDFQAYYYAFGIPRMQADGEVVDLPDAAMIVVPTGVVHGWIGPENETGAAVGHFHEGHGYHFVESVQEGRVLNS